MSHLLIQARDKIQKNDQWQMLRTQGLMFGTGKQFYPS